MTGYTDLTLFDATPSDLVTRALDAAQTTLPDWTPRDSNTEMVMLEATALLAAEIVYAVNRVPPSITDNLLALYGLAPGLGGNATTTVTFTVAAPSSYDLPAGIVVRLDLDGDSVDFATDVAAVIASSDTTITIAATAMTPTALANGTTAGTALTLISSVPYVDSAEIASTVTAGTDPESDDEFRDRGMELLQRLVTTLVKPAHFTAAALQTEAVRRAFTIDNWNVSTSAAGHVTVAVLGAGGATLSGGQKTALQTDLAAQAQANLAVHVVDPTLTPVAVTTSVHPALGYDNATVIANVTAALGDYLSAQTWGWGDTVYRNELIAVIDRVEGVDRVNSVTVPASDVALTTPAPLATAGTITVTAA